MSSIEPIESDGKHARVPSFGADERQAEQLASLEIREREREGAKFIAAPLYASLKRISLTPVQGRGHDPLGDEQDLAGKVLRGRYLADSAAVNLWRRRDGRVPINHLRSRGTPEGYVVPKRRHAGSVPPLTRVFAA